jgi:CheY-like chemotaxis protein
MDEVLKILFTDDDQGTADLLQLKDKSPDDSFPDYKSNIESGLVMISESPEKKTILIAEDDKSNFRLIKQFLSGLNIDIVHACNGIEAVEICKSERRIDLVLMDIKMPEMDGYEAARHILQHSPSMKIIVQTSYADDIAKSMQAGCAGFISKPFNRKQFVDLVKEFL